MRLPRININKSIPTVLKAAGMTALAMLLSVIMTAPFTASTSALFSSPEQSDFQISDLFAQFADSRPVRKLDDRMVVINIGHAQRDEIADILETVSLTEPKAVGLDVLFTEPHEDDSRLLAAIAANPGIIIPLTVRDITGEGDFQIDEKPFFYGNVPGVRYAAVNFPAVSEKARIREFCTGFPAPHGLIASFPMSLAAAADPRMASSLRHTADPRRVISYHSREIPVIQADELDNRIEELTGKTVLIGSTDDASDMHATPINSYMPGVMIHACSTATILDGLDIRTLPRSIDYTLAIAVCFIIMLTMCSIRTLARGLIIRILQVVLVYLVVRIGYTLFIDHQLVCDFSTTMLMIAFGLFAFDIWNGFDVIGRGAISKYKNYKNKNSLPCENSCSL